MIFKKCISVLATVCIAVTYCLPCAYAFNFTPYTFDDDGKEQTISLYSESAYMVNLDTGDVVIDIKADKQRVPASLTKIMTAVVLLEKYKDNPEDLKIDKASAGTEAFDELYDTGASTADIQPDEEVTYYDLLCALMLPSSCEAANIIALNLADSIPEFCDLMNEEAEKLGMDNSHFSNAHGLFENKNYSSCHDIATLCQYALKNFPVFAEIVCMPTYTMAATNEHPDGTLIINTNELLDETSDYYYSPVKGIKTGTLDASGRCLASYASYDGANYMIVTMGAPVDKISDGSDDSSTDDSTSSDDEIIYYNLIDHKKLYQWALYNLTVTDFININSEVSDVKVEFGREANYVNLKPARGYTQVWPDNIDTSEVKTSITVKENVVSPVETGDVLGQMTLTYNGTVLDTIDLIATASVERSSTAEKAAVAKAFPQSTSFKIALAGIIILFVGYTVIFILVLQHKYVKKKK